MTNRYLLFGLVLTGVLTNGLPASAQTAESSLTVQRSLSVATVRPIRITSPGQAASLSLSAIVNPDAPAEVQVTGDPGRVYRIRVPTTLVAQDGDVIVENLKIWSRNTGDVSQTRVAYMDLEGRDLLRITGRLRVEGGEVVLDSISLPLSIDYE